MSSLNNQTFNGARPTQIFKDFARAGRSKITERFLQKEMLKFTRRVRLDSSILTRLFVIGIARGSVLGDRE